MAVEFVHRFVEGKLPDTVLLLHGSGGDENDLLPIGPALAPGASFLSPRGHVVERGGARRFCALPVGGAFEPAEIRQRAGELAEWLGSIIGQYSLDPARVYALGYSNGANMAGALMLLHPGLLAGAFLLRCRAVIRPDPLPDLKGAPVVISAGQTDSVVPLAGAQELARMLGEASAKVDIAIQNSGHDLTPADFHLGKQWFRAISTRDSQ